MCTGGGGGARAKVTQPDYKAANKMAKRQFKAMAKAQDPGVGLDQNRLNQALNNEYRLGQQLRDATMAEADRVSADSARIAAMLGAPPPAKIATAPALGANRETVARGGRGRAGLRLVAPAEDQALQLSTPGGY